MDFSGAATSLGHRHPRVLEWVSRALEEFTGFTGLVADNPYTRRLASMLVSHAPMRSPLVAFASTGSEACDFAIQLARYYTRRTYVLSFIGAYHGLTGTALASSPSHGIRFSPPHTVDAVYSPYPYSLRCPFKTNDCDNAVLDYVRLLIKEAVPRGGLAGIIVEPLQSHGGILVPGAEFFKGLREIVDNEASLLIVDEVYTGAGRTGRLWGIENHDIEPDVVCVGKGIGGGFPLAAVLARKDVGENWPLPSGGSLGTYAGHVISAAAGIGVMEALINDGVVDNARSVGSRLLSGLRDLSDRFEFIAEARGKGVVLGIEVTLEDLKPWSRGASNIINALRELGLLAIKVGIYDNVVKLTPPATLSHDEAEEALSIIEEAARMVGKT
ncbi:MAG: aminotransferase class III-fold pyridoxal phosphate-dependent enzyme [Desulfurococcales archaeon]|nr:aminotransferase class III-fold pyridoxal phosphate-dependent enzyme [Desulfurococcales archaeon]